MSLLKYQLDFSKLSEKDADDLLSKIDRIAFFDVEVSPAEKKCRFFLDERYDVKSLHIPSDCLLTQLHI